MIIHIWNLSTVFMYHMLCFYLWYVYIVFMYKNASFYEISLFPHDVKVATYLHIRWVTKKCQTLKQFHNTVKFGNHFSRVFRIKWSKLYVNTISTIKSYKDFLCSIVCGCCSFFQGLTQHFCHAFISECIFARFVILKLI